MTALEELLARVCSTHRLPGAVALVARGEDVEVATAGVRTLGGPPMTRDTLFRLASLTKPVLAAATMVLVDRGHLHLDDPVDPLLPELTTPMVLRDAGGPVEDPANLEPAERAITLRDLLTFRSGHGFPERFDLPIVARLVDQLGQGPPRPATMPDPDEWMRRLADVPLLHQPGQGWTYNTGADILGVLLARACDATLGDVLAETVLDPCGMTDTGFATSATDRLATYYERDEDGTPRVVDPPEGQWAVPPRFPSGAGGLVSTADDWWSFGRMVLADGEHRRAGRSTRVLSPESVRLMTTSHVDGGPRHLFLDGQGWGFGGGVDIRPTRPFQVAGRYGWIGGTGTAGYVIPATDTVVVWLSQVELGAPDDAAAMTEVLTHAARGNAAGRH
ncbi:beta-lactamase family protein [Nocardioides panacisoli]|uniref:serine hydrolase domain-containing protein n=1 Tax=Nocardioides panacisoli TaxID=627624 RepID=UPI001C62817A|nr:serine hydrolase domain-containing protein [Nocardioides panacisoli]QYJ03326.1 beta-lactamase family protein [Nocardioides panacisoli]